MKILTRNNEIPRSIFTALFFGCLNPKRLVVLCLISLAVLVFSSCKRAVKSGDDNVSTGDSSQSSALITVTYISGPGATFVKNVWYDKSGAPGNNVSFAYSGTALKRPTNPIPPTNAAANLNPSTGQENYKAYFLGWFKSPDSTSPDQKWVFVGDTAKDGSDLTADTHIGSVNIYAHWKKTENQPKDKAELKTLISSGTSPDTVDTSLIGDMSGLFKNLTADYNIDGWDVSNVTNMKEMFSGNVSFNGNITGWNTAKVTDMAAMFSGAEMFNQNIGTWNTAGVTNMSNMFYVALAFNQPIGNWDTSKVTNMKYMFFSAMVFNQPIGDWNTSRVTTMDSAFWNAEEFNQPLGKWNTSKVTNMKYMFRQATIFNQDISGWNTSNVTIMPGMFNFAKAFNQDISGWDVSKVTDLQSTFSAAFAFIQDVSGWKPKCGVYKSAMFQSGLKYLQTFPTHGISYPLGNPDNYYKPSPNTALPGSTCTP